MSKLVKVTETISVTMWFNGAYEAQHEVPDYKHLRKSKRDVPKHIWKLAKHRKEFMKSKCQVVPKFRNKSKASVNPNK